MSARGISILLRVLCMAGFGAVTATGLGDTLELRAGGVVIQGTYAGGRYTDLRVTFTPRVLAEVSQDVSWVDPIIGAKLVVPLSERWVFRCNGDVGGFDVSSKFTWSATGLFGYDFTPFGLPATLSGGYRGLGEDVHGGTGAKEFTWDVVQHGPIFGLDIKFRGGEVGGVFARVPGLSGVGRHWPERPATPFPACGSWIAVVDGAGSRGPTPRAIRARQWVSSPVCWMVGVCRAALGTLSRSSTVPPW